MLKDDGAGSITYGSPLKSVKGPWWVESTPERIVLRAEDKSLAEFEITKAAIDTMTVKDRSGGNALIVKKAEQIGPATLIK